MQRALHAAALLALTGALIPGRLPADEGRVIALRKDTLTVRLSNVPVSDVLDEIGRQSGAEIRGTVRSPRDVSAEFEDVPLPEALHRLLGDQDFALVYTNAGQLRAVKLLRGSDGASAPPSAPTGELARIIASHDLVNLYGDLVNAVGAPSASLPQLFDLGARHENPAVRSEAVRTMVSLVETEPALRNALLAELGTMDDAAVVSLLRNAAGNNAEELVTTVLTQARASDVRLKASSILQRLRKGY